ncbi:MAG: DUF2974 domain-containing protein [Clostridia bacterium]|nr:DUF2974 domain-containing protein [Clostridia bacterium]
MRNINYYVKRFGKFSLAEHPYCDVDALIFSQLSYLTYEGSVGGISEKKDDVCFSDLNTKEQHDLLISETLAPRHNKKLIKLIQNSVRYKNLKVNYFRNRVDEDKEMQFGAIVFVIDGLNIVAFRGTDTTFVGWKEDFNMSYMDVIPAQEQCLIYLHRVADILKGDLHLCGHSKGGNLATYASIFTDVEIQKRIASVYDFDGPGFKRDIFGSEQYKNVARKIHKYIPRDSMIGLIMHNMPKYQIVRCRGISMMQHDPFRWCTTKQGRLDITESTTFNCKVFERAIKEFMNCYSDAERERIVKLTYSIFNAYERSSFVDFRSRKMQYLRAFLKRYRDMNDEQVAYIKKTFREYWNLYHYVRKQMKRERKDLKRRKVCI